MKEELSLEKLKGVKLWITAGPREKFTASEVSKEGKGCFLVKSFLLFPYDSSGNGR